MLSINAGITKAKSEAALNMTEGEDGRIETDDEPIQ